MPFDVATFKNSVTTVLIEGRRRVEESWFQCTITPNGHCAVFAISKQRGVHELIVPALEMLAHAACGSDNCNDLRRWNDEPGRTKEDVLAVYDSAILASTPLSQGYRQPRDHPLPNFTRLMTGRSCFGGNDRAPWGRPTVT